MNDFSEILIAFVISVIVIVCVAVFFWIMPAKTQARLFNDRFKTNYSTSDFMFADYEIKKFHEEKVPQRTVPYDVNLKLGVDNE